MRRIERCRLAVAALACVAPLAVLASADAIEQRFLVLRDLGDGLTVREARGLAVPGERERYDRELRAFGAELARATARNAAVEVMSADLRDGVLALPDDPPPEPSAASCAAPASDGAGLRELRQRTVACFGRAARALPQADGRTLDRLAVLHELARTADPQRRRLLFESMAPMFRSINGDGGAGSPFRRMQPLVAAEWARGDSPVRRNLAALGIDAAELESWLTAILEAWRERRAGARMAPWDYEYAGNPVERSLGARVPLERLRALNDAYHASLGADPRELGIRFDLEPRPGKGAVAFTEFGARPRQHADGSWSSGEPWIFASYSTGGIGNLNELLHETGHAIHIAAIRTSPAFADWPDSDALTEAYAEIFSQEVYEPAWQRRWLGAEAPLADNLQSRYAGIVLDVAWGLFELRVYADPSADPDAVWNDIVGTYLGIEAVPGLSWWARRGQLVESPGYMLNYGVGAVLAADIRARARALRGSPATPDPGYYAWIAERLFRFGRSRGAAEVLQDFLGRPPGPEALLADMRRGALSAAPATASAPAPGPATPAAADPAPAR